MILQLPTIPTGKSRRSAWWRELWRSISARTPIAGDGVELEFKPSGFVIHSKAKRRTSSGSTSGMFWSTIVTHTNIALNLDYVVCTLDDTGETVNVAKPYQLRVLPFDVNQGAATGTVSYYYTSNTQGQVREARYGSQIETQIVSPSYGVGLKLLLCLNPTGGTGVTDCDYIDLNIDARAWGQQVF
jgi:hypothetical protein